MKIFQKTANLPYICGGLGLIGMGLRFWLLQTGLDDKGLLISGHPARWLIALTVAAAAAAVLLALWGRQNAKRSTGMFPGSIPGAVASVVGCVGIAWNVLSIYTPEQTLLVRLTWILGVAAALTAVFLAWCRFKGMRPHFLLRTVVTLYLMFHLVYHYKGWFPETQPGLYGFQLLASACLILAFYHRTALEANLGGRKAYILTNYAAAFFCLVAVPGADVPQFYGAMALWLLGDTGRLYLRPKGPEEGL